MFKNLYQYRELLKSNIKKEIRGKYKGSFLGVLWSFVNPLLMTLVYAIVFPFILRSGPDHYGNAGIIKKVYFPREILPISVATSGLINFVITIPIMIIFLLCSGIGLSWYILLLPVVIICEYILLLGIIFITCAIDVYIRDAEYIINFFVTMLFYATPILYSTDLFGDKAWILNLNPMTTIVNSYRALMYDKTMFNVPLLSIVFIGSFLLLLIGIAVFRKLEKGFAEEV